LLKRGFERKAGKDPLQQSMAGRNNTHMRLSKLYANALNLTLSFMPRIRQNWLLGSQAMLNCIEI